MRMERVMLSQEEKNWVIELLNQIEQKMENVSKRSAHKIPYTTKDGVHDDRSDAKDICW